MSIIYLIRKINFLSQKWLNHGICYFTLLNQFLGCTPNWPNVNASICICTCVCVCVYVVRVYVYIVEYVYNVFKSHVPKDCWNYVYVYYIFIVINIVSDWVNIFIAINITVMGDYYIAYISNYCNNQLIQTEDI